MVNYHVQQLGTIRIGGHGSRRFVIGMHVCVWEVAGLVPFTQLLSPYRRAIL